MIGFQTINGKFADGFELLPLHLQESIMASVTSKEPGKCVFHFYEQQDDRGKVNDSLRVTANWSIPRWRRYSIAI